MTDDPYAAPMALVLAALRDDGLLLMTDRHLPSLATLVAGEPVRGSWWAHPSGKAIYAVATRLEALPEIASAKLIAGKDTWIHRALWPALIAVGAAREPWQLEDRSLLAQQLLAAVTRASTAQTDTLAELGHFGRKALGEAARELERALLVYGESVHTAAGAHAKRLHTWEHWAAAKGLAATQLTAAQGKRQFDDALARLNERSGTRARLPWQFAQ